MLLCCITEEKKNTDTVLFQMTQQSRGPGKVKENTFIRDKGLWVLLLLCFPSAEQPAAQWGVSHVPARQLGAFNIVCPTLAMPGTKMWDVMPKLNSIITVY